MHCYFLLAGDSAIPIIYHVERVRNGRSFMTRTVQARQRGKCIFTTTISFVAERPRGEPCLEHGWDLPNDAMERLRKVLQEDGEAQTKGKDLTDLTEEGASDEDMNKWPFTSRRMGIANSE